MQLVAVPLHRTTRNLARGVCLVVALALFSTAAVVVSTREGQAALLDDVRSDADWILTAQYPDGAIANYTKGDAIWPYLANFAAMGLARARELTKVTKYSDAAWKWLNWYQAHMEPNGFVYDWVVKDGVAVSTGFMDSTDAYAGTFLMAARMAYRADPVPAKILALRSGIGKAVTAIEATMQPDGLTWAKPDWRVKYLMDQAETYAGLLAAVDLATVLGDTALSKRASDHAARMKAGVDATYNTQVAAYDWAIHESGVRQPTEWKFIYSDALQQAWAVAFGLATGTRATALINRFNLEQPKWSQPAAMALFSWGAMEPVGYWPIAGIGFAETAHVLTSKALLNIRSGSLTANRAWPYTTAIAGSLILYAGHTKTTSMIAKLPAALLKPLTTIVGEPLPSPSPDVSVDPTATPSPAAGTDLLPSVPPDPVAVPSPSVSPTPTTTPLLKTGLTLGDLSVEFTL